MLLGVTEDTILSFQDSSSQGQSINVRFRIRTNSNFERRGLDIHTEHTIPLYAALLGADIKIETIKGPVDIKIPPGTQPNEIKRITGKGVRTENGQTGHHYIKLKVAIPKYDTIDYYRELSQKQRQLIVECFSEKGDPVKPSQESYPSIFTEFLANNFRKLSQAIKNKK